MNSQIQKYLQELENKNPDIEFILVVEAGSRAWGFNSQTSDYDIRCVYRYKDPRKYITTIKMADTITATFEEGLYDFHCWELRKALCLLRQSNSGILEWLRTPTIYLEKYDIKEKFLKIVRQMHTKKSEKWHYYNMALRNYRDRIEGQEVVILKKYTYVLRPLGMVDWLMRFPTKEPTIDFTVILEDLKPFLPEEQYQAILKFITDRKEGKLPQTGSPIPELNQYILSVFQAFDQENNKPSQEVNLQGTCHLYQKVQNCYTTIQAILRKNGSIKRKEYLGIIGFIFQYMWLRKNPTKNLKDVPTKIHDIIPVVKDNLNPELLEFIKLISSRDSDLYIKKSVSEDDRMINDYIWKTHLLGSFLGPLIDSIKYINLIRFGKENNSDQSLNQEGFSKKILDLLNPYPDNRIGGLEEDYEILGQKDIQREDLVEYLLSQWIPSILWLLENPESSYSRIPKQPLNELQITSSMRETIRLLIKESKVTYEMEKVDELHQWIEEFIKSEKETVEKETQVQLKLKEERVKVAYDHSLQDLDDSVFDDLLHQLTFDFKS